MSDARTPRLHPARRRAGIAAIVIPGLSACVLFALSAATASAVEGKYDYMSEGPGGTNPLDQASLFFSIGLALLIATMPGVALLAASHRRPRLMFICMVVATILVVAFASYFVSWMLARPVS